MMDLGSFRQRLSKRPFCNEYMLAFTHAVPVYGSIFYVLHICIAF